MDRRRIGHTPVASSRREFLRSAAAAGTGLALATPRILSAEARKAETLNVAIIGAGTQGRLLLDNCRKIGGGIRLRAVCDIWPRNRGHAVRLLGKFHPAAKGYEDYREMLAAEKDLDAVIVATPDWMHAEHAVAAMKAGLHVY